jgi:O-antigen/teichoic acid export membrane protein
VSAPTASTATAPIAAGPRKPSAHEPGGSLKNLVVKGSLWTGFGYVASQALRLCSNLILTRLLAPDVFGLTALVTVIMQGLNMLTDIGLGPSVVQNKRGGDPEFLDTAWTLQVIRGVGIWLICCVIAWPASLFYESSLLAWVLPATAFTVVINSLSSMSVHLVNKQLKLGRLAFVDLFSLVVQIVVAVLVALVEPTVWAIVIGGLVSSAVKAMFSYTIMRELPRRQRVHHLRIERDAIRSMIRFGRWITLNTILSFVYTSCDRLILGRFMTKQALGIYTMGYFIPQSVVGLLHPISSRVLFPLCVHLLNSENKNTRRVLLRVKAAIMALTLPLICILVIFGPQIIRIMYDPRYHGAGWILRWTAASTIVTVNSAVVGPMLLATGDSFKFMHLTLFRSIVMLLTMFVGGSLYGTTGLIIGFALAPFLCYPILAFYAHKYKVWFPVLDAIGFLGPAAVIAVGLLLNP